MELSTGFEAFQRQNAYRWGIARVVLSHAEYVAQRYASKIPCLLTFEMDNFLI